LHFLAIYFNSALGVITTVGKEQIKTKIYTALLVE